MKPKEIIPIVKLTETCNFTCKYCHYTRIKCDENSRMSIVLLKQIIKEVAEYNRNNSINRVTIVFHGGEPLLAGIEYFEKVMDYETQLIQEYDDGFRINNCIQTNGSLVNNEWIELFDKHKFRVGVSIDGDEHLNCHFGAADVLESTNLVLNNIKELQKNGIKCGILSVITNEHTEKAHEYYEFLKKNNLTSVGLLPCIAESVNMSVDRGKLTKFLIELFDLYYHNDYKLNIREFNIAIEKKYGLKSADDRCIASNRALCGSFMAFDVKGNAYFCDTAYHKRDQMGNIGDFSLVSIIDSKLYKYNKSKSTQFYDENCKECEVVSMCAGSCFRRDIEEEGKTINFLCESNKVLFKHIEKVIIGNC